MQQHYFDVPFAFGGDVTAIPDPTQAGGTVSMTEGWNYNYQRDLTTDPLALPIDRSTMNWLLQQITKALQALQQTSVPEFILASQNGGTAFSYGAGSEVLWSASGTTPFTKFVSLTAGNANTPSLSDPTGVTTGWQIVVDPLATAAQAAAGTNNASIMTPLLVAQQTALRALLAGNSSQVFNVAAASSPTQAPQLQQVLTTVNRTVITAGSGTYTTPTVNGALAKVLRVRMQGDGGGGASSGTGAANGSNGTGTTFGTYGVSGGGGGVVGGVGGTGGNSAGNDVNVTGQQGSAGVPSSAANYAGGNGGVSAFGGAGVGQPSANGTNAQANSGSGGGGAGGVAGAVGSSGGGGAGGYGEQWIINPGPSYAYSVGAGGNGNSAGASYAGGKGGNGILIAEAFA